MRKITKETVFAERGKRFRKMYLQNGIGKKVWSGLQTDKSKPTFSTYIRSAKKIFEAQTGLKLRYSSMYNNYWAYVDREEIAKIKIWEDSQETLVYLEDCLALSIALSINFAFCGDVRTRTPIGWMEYNGKKKKDESSIHQLAHLVEQQILNLPYYKDANLICSVPSAPDKDYDFPCRVTSLVSEKICKQNITEGFVFGGPKVSIKNVSLDEKWPDLEKAQISFQDGDEFDINGRTVILIDDKYQSGVTIQHIAMKLQQAGAREVYGLCFVKTLSDKDNMPHNTDSE